MINQIDDQTTPCVYNPDLFFPESTELRKLEAAQSVCASCPKRKGCLDYAVKTQQSHGVWGGVNFGTAIRDRAQPIQFGPDGWPIEIIDRTRFAARFCRSGRHEWTPENTLWVRQHGTISRNCRACRAAKKKSSSRSLLAV
ncbi:Transcription factor WhiB-like protein [Mycobacteroides abscessus subsp. abscessus]|nr:Transcription factor WhiB-like protein [Mycobacteroides abscessus subsp. abscessus]